MSTLSGRPVKVVGINERRQNPGLQGFEASFLRLVDKMTNGTQVRINETGTELRFTPGVVVGGRITHDCGLQRSMGYFLECIIPLAIFAKKAVHLTLTGITNDDMDLTVDTLRTTTLPLLRHFGVSGDIQLQIKKRGAPPSGGGEVIFVCPIVKQLEPIHLVEEGFVKRVRGVAYATRVSPQTSNRMVEAARGVLNAFLPDVHIFTDHYKGTESGNSPGFGLSLVAKTTEDCLISAECTASKGGTLPEDIGRQAALMLCQEVANRGCVDTSNQSLCLLLMVLGPEDVSKIRLGKLSPYTIVCLRQLRDFFGVTFKIAPDPKTKTIFLSCLGIGFKNMARGVC
eukprot:g4605.t1